MHKILPSHGYPSRPEGVFLYHTYAYVRVTRLRHEFQG